jgi:hypothetical protein
VLATLTESGAAVIVAAIAATSTVIVGIMSYRTNRNSKQLLENGGSTVADAVKRTELAVLRIEDRLHTQGERIAALEAKETHV